MLHFVSRAGWLLPVTLSVVSFSAEPDQSDSVMETVYSEFIPASETSPEFSTSQVTVIHYTDFSAGDTSVADVIEQSPSVQIQDTGELGSVRSISVRGAPSQQTNIYIDGVLITGAGGNGNYLQHIPLADIERIEVYPGSLPLQFSQASPGGAINIVRKKMVSNSGVLLLETGQYGRRRVGLSGTLRKNNWASSAYVEALNAENDFAFSHDNGTPDNSGDDYTAYRNNAQYESMQGGLKLSYQVGERQLYAQVDGVSTHKNLPNFHNFDVEDAYYDTESVTAQTGIHINQWMSGVDSSLSAQAMLKSGHFSDLGNNVGTFKNDSYDDLTSYQVMHHSLVGLPVGNLAINNEVRFDTFAINDDLRGERINAQRIGYDNSAGFDWFLTDTFTASAVLRSNALSDEQNDVNSNKHSLGGQIGLRADIGSTYWQINAVQSVRQPSLIERFGNVGSFVGNPELENETSFGVDALIHLQDERLALNFSVFYREAENAIAPTYNSQGVGRYVNLNSATYQGVEWDAVLALTDAVQLVSSGSVQNAEIESPMKAYDGKNVPGFYPISLTQKIQWRPIEQVRFDIEYANERGLYYDRSNSTKAPDKHNVNGSIHLQFQPVEITFSASNLLDREHLDYSRMPLPGRTYLATLKYYFGDSL